MICVPERPTWGALDGRSGFCVAARGSGGRRWERRAILQGSVTLRAAQPGFQGKGVSVVGPPGCAIRARASSAASRLAASSRSASIGTLSTEERGAAHSAALRHRRDRSRALPRPALLRRGARGNSCRGDGVPIAARASAVDESRLEATERGLVSNGGGAGANPPLIRRIRARVSSAGRTSFSRRLSELSVSSCRHDTAHAGSSSRPSSSRSQASASSSSATAATRGASENPGAGFSRFRTDTASMRRLSIDAMSRPGGEPRESSTPRGRARADRRARRGEGTPVQRGRRPPTRR